MIAIELIRLKRLDLVRSPSKRIVFLAPTNPIAEQQYSVLCEQLGEGQDPHNTIGLCDSTPQHELFSGDNEPPALHFGEAFRRCQTVVATPMKFLHALLHGRVSMDDVALIILDEAHHCRQAKTRKDRASAHVGEPCAPLPSKNTRPRRAAGRARHGLLPRCGRQRDHAVLLLPAQRGVPAARARAHRVAGRQAGEP